MSLQRRRDTDYYHYEFIENIWDDDITAKVVEVDVDGNHVNVHLFIDDHIYSGKLNKRQVHVLALALQRAEKRLA